MAISSTLKILYPTLVAVAVVLLWQGTVSYFRIPAFLVPSHVGKQGGFHKPVLHQDKRHRGADDNRQQKRDQGDLPASAFSQNSLSDPRRGGGGAPVAGHGKLFPHPGRFHKPVLHQDKRHRGADDNRQQKRDQGDLKGEQPPPSRWWCAPP
jgi:hypothetical protein